MQHLIATVNLQVHAVGRVDGFAIQHEMSRWFWSEYLSALEILLDKIIPEDQVIRIDKLDIAIPPLSPDHWREDLTGLLIKALQEQLNPFVRGGGLSESEQTTTKGTKSAATGAVASETGVTHRSRTQHHFEAWLFFLKNGRLPLLYASVPETARLTAVLENVAANTAATTILTQLLQRDATALQRLVLQHDTKFLTLLAEAITGKKMGALGQSQAALFTVLTDAPFVRFITRVLRQTKAHATIQPPEARGFERLFWQQGFAAIATTPPPFDIRFFVENLFKETFHHVFAIRFEELLDKLAKRPEVPHKRIDFTLDKLEKILLKTAKGAVLEGYFKEVMQDARTLERDSHSSQTPDGPSTKASAAKGEQSQDGTTSFSDAPASKSMAAVSTTDKEGDSQASTPDKTTLASGIPPSKSSATGTPSTNGEGNQASILPSPSLSKNESEALPEPDAFYLQDAGLVLLHPFLPALFAAGNLTEAGVFINDTAHEKAVQWLHYLATGTTNPPEYELILPKLLCGMAFHRPIDRQNLLTEDDLNEGETLLRAVIKHWGVLGNVGSDSLREGFLRRDGKLSRRDDGGWRLQVETKTLDILLSRLPWGIGLIKLKWMKDMLYVEWN